MSTKTTPTRSRWFALVWVIPLTLAVLAALVLVAQWWRGLPEMQSFLADYPGETELPDGAPVGFPAWVGWQHFLNFLLIVLIIRSGWQVRTTQRPPAYWTRNNKGLIRTKGAPKKISLDLWFHQSLDVLWVLNGLVFYVLLFTTGQWMRLVPTSWDVFPNAFSAALQYVSLNWPTENGWVNYNSLQLLAYFVTVFVAAPLAIITGIRMSGAWSARATRLSKLYPVEWARAVHFPVMIYFVLFIIVHVTLVLATGALRNLNHMYAMTDDPDSWVGFWIFAASIVVTVIAWFAARPLFLRPVAALSGSVTR
jgi:thiosulfate reductase cytochrome b subunit